MIEYPHTDRVLSQIGEPPGSLVGNLTCVVTLSHLTVVCWTWTVWIYDFRRVQGMWRIIARHGRLTSLRRDDC